MTHWRVRRETTYYFDPDGNDAFGLRWCVYSPSGLYWGNYKNHAEAMARADKQARTLQVVLPRQPLPLTLPGSEEDSPVVVTQDPEIEYVFLTDEYDGEVVPLYRRDLRPLALALLALAEKENNE